MIQAGLSHRRLAEEAGVRHHSTIDHLMSGARKNASARDAAKISRALRTEPDLLFESDETGS